MCSWANFPEVNIAMQLPLRLRNRTPAPLPAMTSDFYHRWLVFPGFEPHIKQNHTVCPSCNCLLKCACEIGSSYGSQLIWVPFWTFIMCRHSARWLKGSVHLLQIPRWASDKPVKRCGRQKTIAWNQAWVRIPALPLFCCVTWGQFLHLPELQFPYL